MDHIITPAQDALIKTMESLGGSYKQPRRLCSFNCPLSVEEQVLAALLVEVRTDFFIEFYETAHQKAFERSVIKPFTGIANIEAFGDMVEAAVNEKPGAVLIVSPSALTMLQMHKSFDRNFVETGQMRFAGVNVEVTAYAAQVLVLVLSRGWLDYRPNNGIFIGLDPDGEKAIFTDMEYNIHGEKVVVIEVAE